MRGKPGAEKWREMREKQPAALKPEIPKSIIHTGEINVKPGYYTI